MATGATTLPSSEFCRADEWKPHIARALKRLVTAGHCGPAADLSSRRKRVDVIMLLLAADKALEARYRDHRFKKARSGKPIQPDFNFTGSGLFAKMLTVDFIAEALGTTTATKERNVSDAVWLWVRCCGIDHTQFCSQRYTAH